MFDIGFSELLLIFVIGLVVLGPERLPKAARTLGYWMGRAKSTFNNLRNELEREALNQEMRQRMEKQMRDMGLDEDSIRQARDSLLSPEDTTRARRRDGEKDQPAVGQPGRVIDHDDDAQPESRPTHHADPDRPENDSDAR